MLQICQLLLKQPWFSERVLYEAVSRALINAKGEEVRKLLVDKQQECM